MSTRKLAIIMDPIKSINPDKDSSLAMLLEAQNRGWELYCGQMDDIWLREGRAFGNMTELHVMEDRSNWFNFRDPKVIPLGDMDVVLMRKDPPFDLEYIIATYILQRAEEHGALVVNSPQGLRDANEKAFLSWFPDCAPPTLISRSMDEMRTFMKEHHKVVVKPLDKMGGQSVFVTDMEDGNHNVILENVSQNGTRYTMVQKYIPEITSSGDKRIFLIDGRPIPFTLVRIPCPSDHRGNMVTGARVEVQRLSNRDIWICNQVGPTLRERGLLFTGIDVIGDFMTEINVTSPTGIIELERESDVLITEQLFNAIESKLK